MTTTPNDCICDSAHMASHLPNCPIVRAMPAHLLGPDGMPCEGCEGAAGLPPVTTLGFCPICRDAAIRNHGPVDGRRYVGDDMPLTPTD